jgi:hypothetical protein
LRQKQSFGQLVGICETWRCLLEERQDIATLQLAANNHLAASVNAVNLENRLGDV